jgi:hypothetical protein
MADDAAVAGEDRNLEPEPASRRRIAVDVRDVELRHDRRELRDEVVAERAVLARVDEEPVGRHPRRLQSRWFAAARAWSGDAAGRRLVAIAFSVRVGTSPTAVIWWPSTTVVYAEATPERLVPSDGT